MTETAPEKRQEQILAALKRIDGQSGLEKKPSVNDVGKAVGYQVTAEERDTAWNTFRPVEAPRAAKDPSKDWPQIANKSKMTLIIGATTLIPGQTAGVREWVDLKKNSACVQEWLKLGFIAEA